VLAELEAAGFFGMRIEHPGVAGSVARVTANKGKDGPPCYDTGRTARYTGSASAALDDAGHLLFGDMRVCEKTAQMYASEPYCGLVRVSEAAPQLLARLRTSPAPFDCDSFEADAAKLGKRLAAQTAAPAETVPVLYAGPFRLLVLPDGSMLHRGRAVAGRLPTTIYAFRGEIDATGDRPAFRTNHDLRTEVKRRLA
jgi:hypothetical protein